MKNAPMAQKFCDQRPKTTFATQSAICGPSASQQNGVLFDHRIGADKQGNVSIQSDRRSGRAYSRRASRTLVRLAQPQPRLSPTGKSVESVVRGLESFEGHKKGEPFERERLRDEARSCALDAKRSSRAAARAETDVRVKRVTKYPIMQIKRKATTTTASGSWAERSALVCRTTSRRPSSAASRQ
jgi:hypothetical protein